MRRTVGSWSLCLILALCIFALCGCRSESTDAPAESPVPPFAGQTVVFSYPERLPVRETWELAAQEWQAVTGAECRFAPRAEPGLPTDSSIAILPLAEIPDALARGQLATLPATGDAADVWDDLVIGVRRGFALAGGEPTLFPLSAPTLLLYYRADLLQTAGLAAPQTWEEYDHLAATVGDWAPGLVVAEPWHESFRGTLFLSRAASFAVHPDNRSFDLDLQSGRSLVDTPPFQRALEDCAHRFVALPESDRNWTPADCRREMLSARAALAIAWEPVPTLDDWPEEDATGGRPDGMSIGIAPLPGAVEIYDRDRQTWEAAPEDAANRTAVVGFAGQAIVVNASADSGKREAAWNLWRTLRSDAATQDSPLGGVCQSAGEARLVAALAPELRTGERSAAASAMTHTLASGRLVFELPFPDREQFRLSLVRAIGPALTGETTAEAALKEVVTEWEQRIETLGRKGVINVSRALHGLRPLP